MSGRLVVAAGTEGSGLADARLVGAARGRRAASAARPRPAPGSSVEIRST